MHIITSTHHPLIKRLTQLVRSKEARILDQELLIEGETLIYELSKKIPLKKLLVTDRSQVDGLHYEELYLVKETILEKISTTNSPPKMVATVAFPQESSLLGMKRLLCLDHIQDPGNVGTLFRTAHALGFDGIFLITPCADPFNDKVMRAAKGANLLLPYKTGPLQDFLALSSHYTLLAASLKGTAVKPTKTPFILVLGHETRGISKEIIANAHEVTIPMQKEADSLNVASAGAILLYLLHEEPL